LGHFPRSATGSAGIELDAVVDASFDALWSDESADAAA
jgi:hypothetical protein